MGLQHSTYLAYGIEIPATTDFEHLGSVLAEQPGPDRVHHLFLGDFERLFLATECKEIEENTFAQITQSAFTRYEIPAWNEALNRMAGRLGHEKHPDPAWLVLHDYS
jgi:hypothetical protein